MSLPRVVLSRFSAPIERLVYCKLCLKQQSCSYYRKTTSNPYKLANFRQKQAVTHEYLPKKVDFKRILPDKPEEPVLVDHYPAKEKLKHCDQLMQFFEPKDSWGEGLVKDCFRGQSWSLGVLRGKSHCDLHKLWYVLLKERNVLLTLDRECEETDRTTPHEDRLEKAEQSMENILNVVEERDGAVDRLENERSRPKGAYTWNMFGFRYWKWFREHSVPWWENERFRLENTQYRDYVIPWMRLRLERRRTKLLAQRRHFERRLKESAKKYPNVPMPPLPEVDNPLKEEKFDINAYMHKYKNSVEHQSESTDEEDLQTR